MANGDMYFVLAYLGGLQERRVLILELPESGEDFISYGRKEMIDEFDKRLDKDKVKHRGIEM